MQPQGNVRRSRRQGWMVLTSRMTTDRTQRDLRPIYVQVAEHERDLAELREAMQARAAMRPGSPEFEEALAYEEELLERIHEWSLGHR